MERKHFFKPSWSVCHNQEVLYHILQVLVQLKQVQQLTAIEELSNQNLI